MAFKRVINVVECHSGEPMSVITGGVMPLKGNTVYEKMKYLEEHDDALRHLILNEPRGYVPQCSNILVDACHPDADYGYIILEHEEYPMMSGGNTIAVATVLLETGIIEMKEPYTDFTLECPGGLIGIHAECHNGKCTQVTFKNMASFAQYIDAELELPEYGKVKVDVAWGGMWYVICDHRQFKGLKLIPEHGAEISKINALLVAAANEQLEVYHPDFPDLKVECAELSGPTDNPNADWTNSEGMVCGPININNPFTWKTALDRCPCGTGTCAKMAAQYARGELGLNEQYRLVNPLGIIYTGELVEKTKVGDYDAVIPTVGGEAWIIGFNTVVLDDTDPFPEGYRMGDIWAME